MKDLGPRRAFSAFLACARPEPISDYSRSMEIHGDFETYSEADLKECGVERYARHPSTEVLCFAYCVSDKSLARKGRIDPTTKHVDGCPVALWFPGRPFPPILELAIQAGWPFVAWNAAFERYVWKYVCQRKYGWPAIPVRNLYCAQARAAYLGLPRKLDRAVKVLELPEHLHKDAEGHKTMLRVSKPYRGKRRHIASELAATHSYCRQDVVAEAAVDRLVPPLNSFERELWLVDRKINERGVPIDVDLCRGANLIIDEALRRNAVQLSALTDETITSPTQTERIKNWFAENNWSLPTNDQGKPSMDAEAVEEALEDTRLPKPAKKILTIRAESAAASVKKFRKAIAYVNPATRRIYEQFKHFAAATGRWGGSGVQVHNLRRADQDLAYDFDELYPMICKGDCDGLAEFGPPIEVLSNCIRQMICAKEGKVLVDSDLSGIEHRILHTLADNHEVLKKIRDKVDLYIEFAANELFHVDPAEITKGDERRQIGKVGELSSMYCAGVKSIMKQAKKAGVEIDLTMAQSMVDAYRGKHTQVTKLWRTIERACMSCVKTGKPINCGRYGFDIWNRDWLRMRLPSGRFIYYYKPEIVDGLFGPEVRVIGNKGPTSLGRSTLANNLVQGTARDVMAQAMVRLDRRNIFIVSHVHDSIVSETTPDKAEKIKRIQEEELCRPLDWLPELPLASETKIDRRVS